MYCMFFTGVSEVNSVGELKEICERYFIKRKKGKEAVSQMFKAVNIVILTSWWKKGENESLIFEY